VRSGAIDSVWIQLGPIWTVQTRDFATEVNQVINRKVVDQSTLYNLYKGCMGFFSTICAQIACQDADFLGADE
jgi:hypothetical protein